MLPLSPIVEAKEKAQEAARILKRRLTDNHVPDVALVLGTGWGDALRLKNPCLMPLGEVPGFKDYAIQTLPGHSRTVVSGYSGQKRVIALSGRLHLNEHPTDPNLPVMVRLQIQMLVEMGVKHFILTNAAGSLQEKCQVGDIIVADGFISVFAPAMPLYGGEFCPPEDKMSPRLQDIALEARPFHEGKTLTIHAGGYAMLRGPCFEGRKYDKPILSATGAMAVGMSTWPEMCILALYEQTEALCLSFITNTASEEHSHEENQARAKRSSALLGAYLEQIIERI